MSDHSSKRSQVDASQRYLILFALDLRLFICRRKIFIGGLSYNTDDGMDCLKLYMQIYLTFCAILDKLKEYFEVYGEVQDAVVMKDPVSKRSRGFGFITFTDISSVDNVLNAFLTSSTSSTIINENIGTNSAGHTNIDGRRVEVKRAVPRSNEPPLPQSIVSSIAATVTASPNVNTIKHVSVAASSTQSTTSGTTTTTGTATNTHRKTSEDIRESEQFYSSLSYNNNLLHGNEYAYNKIFVGGLHYDTRDQEFKNYFEKFGKIITSEVMFNRETHKSRGFGFVVYEVEKSAEAACAVTEHVIDGRVVCIFPFEVLSVQ